MVASLAIFFIIGIYLDNVLPNTYGLQKHWYYLITPSYWQGTAHHSGMARKNSKNAIDADTEQETVFEAKYMKKENYEPVTRDLIKQEDDKKILKI